MKSNNISRLEEILDDWWPENEVKETKAKILDWHKQECRRTCLKVIGKDESLKNVKNRSILDSPKVKNQNLYRADRNKLRQSQRKRLADMEKNIKEGL